jgi:hypothetical protein
LKEKFIISGLEPVGLNIPLGNIRAEAEPFRNVNLPLLSGEKKLSAEYDPKWCKLLKVRRQLSENAGRRFH